MRRVADYLETNKKRLSQTLFADKETISELIQTVLPKGAIPLKILYHNQIITLHCSAAIKNEVFMKKEKILSLIKQKLPHLSVIDLR